MLPVTKYHGCGNDFIILREEDAVGYDLNTLIPAVCDRHTGPWRRRADFGTGPAADHAFL